MRDFKNTKGLITSLIIRLLRVVSGIVLSIIISRHFGVETLGHFAVMEKTILTLIILSSIYTLPLIVTLVKERDVNIVWFIKRNFLTYTIISFLFLIGNIYFFGFEQKEMLFFLIGGAFEIITITISYYLVANSRLALSTLAEGTLKVSVLAFIVFVGSSMFIGSPELLGLYYLISNILVLFVVAALFKLRYVRTPIIKNEKINYNFYISKVINFLLRNSNLLIASILCASDSVGIYSVAIKISFSFNLLYQITTNWQLPYIKDSLIQRDNLNYIKKISRAAFAVSIFLVIILSFAHQRIISWWNIEIEDIAFMLIILLIGQFINVSAGPVEQVILLKNDAKWNRNANAILLSFQVLLMFSLGTFFGIIGVVLSEVIVLVVGNIVRYARLKNSGIEVGIL